MTFSCNTFSHLKHNNLMKYSRKMYDFWEHFHGKLNTTHENELKKNRATIIKLATERTYKTREFFSFFNF